MFALFYIGLNAIVLSWSCIIYSYRTQLSISCFYISSYVHLNEINI